MKRIFLLVSLLFLSVLILFAGEFEMDFVSFTAGDDFEESISMFDHGLGFKRGELDPVTNTLGEGVYFQIGIDGGIGDDMIAEMKADETTTLEEESFSSIDGYSVEVYSGQQCISPWMKLPILNMRWYSLPCIPWKMKLLLKLKWMLLSIQ
jgi:hypothetical protein